MPNFIMPPLGVALLINAGLLGVFAIQHSVMARPAFKRWWTRIIPQEAERSAYTLLSAACSRVRPLDRNPKKVRMECPAPTRRNAAPSVRSSAT